jgi:hypothetical protein
MGLQALSGRKKRAISQAVGLDVVWASVGPEGRYVGFTTDDHAHGWYDTSTGEFSIECPGPDHEGHFDCCGTSCRILFGPRGDEIRPVARTSHCLPDIDAIDDWLQATPKQRRNWWFR